MADKNKKPAKETKKEPAAPRRATGGLGRGLDALISAQPKPVVSQIAARPELLKKVDDKPDGRSILRIPAAEIERSPWQPRHAFDEEALRELAESIRRHGIIQPLICRRTPAGRYELIAGERRLRAAVEAEQSHVPVILVDAEDRRAAEMAIIENIQRQDLNHIEEAEGYRTLAEAFSLTQQEVAERVGKARATVANALRLLELPDETKQLVADGRLSTGHAKVLLAVTVPDEQVLLARKCVMEGLTVRMLERIIQRRREESRATRKEARPDMPESHVRDLADRMHRHFGTAIRLFPGATHANGRHTKGLIEIDFYDNDDLDRILTLLGISAD